MVLFLHLASLIPMDPIEGHAAPPDLQFPVFSPTFEEPDFLQFNPSALSNHQQSSSSLGCGVAPSADLATLLFSSSTAPQREQAASLEMMERTEGNSSGKEKKAGGRTKKASRPRFAFQTRSANDILDDGYRWRKYGQKAVKNSIYPRSYYRCTQHMCNVKKQVQRLSKDTSIVVTTYEGVHNHPCEKLMETLSPLLKQMQFLSQF